MNSTTLFYFVGITFFVFFSCSNDTEYSQSPTEFQKDSILEMSNESEKMIEEPQAYPNYKDQTPLEFPFTEKLEAVRLVSYLVPREGHELSESAITTKIVLNDTIGYNLFREDTLLNQNQIDSLQKLLMNFENPDYEGGSDCYNPRNCFYFLGKGERVLGYLEICFECFNSKASHSAFTLICIDQYRAIENFIGSCGIKNGIHGMNDDRYKVP